MHLETSLKQTPLYNEHLLLNARVVPFGGWEMPVQYDGILKEYNQTRANASLFDTCHMGEFYLKGHFKKCGLDQIVTQRLADMPLKTCRYGLLLNHKGGVIDDLIVYRLGEEEWMIVVNGATTEKDARQFQVNLSAEAVFENASPKIGKLDLQGPLSRDVLKEMIPGIKKLSYFTFDHFEFLGEKNIVSRTGYTGELGYEIYFSWENMPKLWRTLLKNADVKPAGLGARDVLRLEMCYSLYGQELDEGISPLEAGLEKFIDFEKDFVGKDALLKQKKDGPKRKMICFASVSRQSPRHNHKIYFPENQEIGMVTSGSFSPALTCGIGMGLVTNHVDLDGKTFFFGDEKNKIQAKLFKRPFYKHGSLKN